MKRRTLLATAAAALAAPRIGNAQAAKPLRFVPDADLALVSDHGFERVDRLANLKTMAAADGVTGALNVQAGLVTAEILSHSRMRPDGVIDLAPVTREWIAAFLHAAGVRPKASTFIDDQTITYGYGSGPDWMGEWEFPLYV